MKPQDSMEFTTVHNKAELATLICTFRDQTARYEKQLIDECRKHNPDEEELLFLASEYSKTKFLLIQYENINIENQLGI